jgi:uncharacterized protein YutE (UPF0331/DUF86 family)
MRDKLIHEYFGVNLELVWVTIKNELPELKNQILKILKEIEEGKRYYGISENLELINYKNFLLFSL